jgi:hypothetical protein
MLRQRPCCKCNKWVDKSELVNDLFCGECFSDEPKVTAYKKGEYIAARIGNAAKVHKCQNKYCSQNHVIPVGVECTAVYHTAQMNSKVWSMFHNECVEVQQ